MPLNINADRLWATLMEMGEFGATPKGGCNRQALTDLDKQARDLFVEWCGAEGCAVRIDKAGNIFARRPGEDASRLPVSTGSHLDTQPTGGKFDGVYGVLAGVEVLRTLNEQNIKTAAPIEVIVWMNEEGYRFDPAMMGSGVYANVFTLEETLDKVDRDGTRLGDELTRIGYAGETGFADEYKLAAYIETHIEQGPILEAEDKTVGIVTAAQGIRSYQVRIIGQEVHAGPTPMELRKDALIPAAEIALEVNKLANGIPLAKGTVGEMRVLPGSRNITPSDVFFTIDLRHEDADVLEQMHVAVERFYAEAQERHPQCEFSWEDCWLSPVVPFDETVIAASRKAVEALGYSWRNIVSGAGHDACYVAKMAPTAMIFIPCKDGISHNEEESATPEDIEAGCNVLLNALIELAQ